jgi:hypothetical protein
MMRTSRKPGRLAVDWNSVVPAGSTVKISGERLLRESEAAGFLPEIEKVFRPRHPLESLPGRPFLTEKPARPIRQRSLT